jgi:hypothetical protein
MNTQQQLRESIYNTLNSLSEFDYPHILQRTQNEVGYKMLEEQIINMMIAQKITVITAIQIIENEDA